MSFIRNVFSRPSSEYFSSSYNHGTAAVSSGLEVVSNLMSTAVGAGAMLVRGAFGFLAFDSLSGHIVSAYTAATVAQTVAPSVTPSVVTKVIELAFNVLVKHPVAFAGAVIGTAVMMNPSQVLETAKSAAMTGYKVGETAANIVIGAGELAVAGLVAADEAFEYASNKVTDHYASELASIDLNDMSEPLLGGDYGDFEVVIG